MKKVIRWLFYVFAILAMLVISLVGRIDRTPLHEQPFYHEMMAELDTTKLVKSAPTQKLKIGWGKYNITPAYEMPMAGYKPRDHFDSVHDSLFARVMAIDNGRTTFIISLDLLIFPPTLKEKIESEVINRWPDSFLYFSATHTHNGLGGWDKSLAGQLIAGHYHQEWIDQITSGILQTMETIKQNLVPGAIAYYETDAKGYAINRLAGDNGKVDAKIRGIKLIREDSSKAILVAFSAHATSISKTIKSLSGDYPAVLERELEKNGYDFALYMAGMVGSHALNGFDEHDFELTEKAGKTLAGKILNESITDKSQDSVSITTALIPVKYGPSELRFEQNLRLRDWAFSSLLGSLQGEITVLEIGDIIFLGTPCDFSGELSVVGELDKMASSKGKKLIITSFNGNYTGYITLDDHYDHYKKEEVMALNWVGPYFGQYHLEIIQKILAKD